MVESTKIFYIPLPGLTATNRLIPTLILDPDRVLKNVSGPCEQARMSCASAKALSVGAWSDTQRKPHSPVRSLSRAEKDCLQELVLPQYFF